MPKTSARSSSAKPQYERAVRGRDAEFPGASMIVTESAQARLVDIQARKQSEFSLTVRNVLPKRPSTSGGPTKSSARRYAEKRETKDDLYSVFNPLRTHGTGTTFYNFPLPGSLPTPSDTPASSPPARTSSLPRSDTPESMEYPTTNLHVPQMEIGMALGSPTHQPSRWQTPSPLDRTVRNETPDSTETFVDSELPVATPSRQKSSKWKIFGGLFGGGKRNQSGSPQTFYQLRPEEAETGYVEHEEPSSSGPKPSQTRGRGRSHSQRKTKMSKPDIKRSQTAPLNFEFASSHHGRTRTETPQITVDGSMSEHPGTRTAGGGLLLDVDIPSIHMERYSIMFGSLLQKPPGPSSSLLARRQATLDRLKTANEELTLKEQELEEKANQLRTRRATSPQPARSPAFSLFPSTPSRFGHRDTSSSPNHRKLLQRSNTSPAVLSPSRPTFAPGPNNEIHATLMVPGPHLPLMTEPEEMKSMAHPPATLKVSKQSLEAARMPQPSSRDWSLDQSHLRLDSPSSDAEDASLVPVKPKIDQPAWQMVAPQHFTTSSVSGSTSSNSDHSTSTSASSISTTSIAPFTVSSVRTVKIQPPSQKARSRSSTTSTALRRKDSEVSISSSSGGVYSQSIPASQAAQLPVPKKAVTLVTTQPALSSHQKSPPISTFNTSTPSTTTSESEARLKTAADVSIARQISVSRQQRQLLIPIKASSLSSKHSQNFPSPLDRVGAEGVNKVTSPLGMVAASIKPATPTLVVLGSGRGEGEKWLGKAVESPVIGKGKGRGGLRVMSAGRNGGLSPVEVLGHQHRKSENVVVERISVAESS